jgi:hypothetical protein
MRNSRIEYRRSFHDRRYYAFGGWAACRSPVAGVAAPAGTRDRRIGKDLRQGPSAKTCGNPAKASTWPSAAELSVIHRRP